LNVQDWTGFVGQWDDRIWKTTVEPIPQSRGASPPGGGPQVRLNEYGEMIGIRPGFIKRADIGWFASHRHDASGSNEPYAYSYLFVYAIDVPSSASTFTLPRNHNIRVLAVTAANQNARTRPAQPLYDVLNPAENRTPE
jgi:alpha-mannosidase